MIRNIILWITVVITMISTFTSFKIRKYHYNNNIDYSSFLNFLHNNKIKDVNISSKYIKGHLLNNKLFYTFMPPINDNSLFEKLIKKNIIIRCIPQYHQSILMHIFISWFPMLLLICIWLFFIRQISNKSGGPLSFGQSKARMFKPNDIKINFSHIAGIKHVINEIKDIIDFLKNPKKYENIGAKIPQGILLMGPPGTGKTLLAKALAGEAQVPYFTISGSDFVEMFVGVGASRVRNMFNKAKKNSPCIIFIDEIDAVGRHRGIGMGGGNDEREQTLNQMLVEMDGFSGKEGIIVIAATNRPDVLDHALLRPGRFDRHIHVSLPNYIERKEILNLHIKKVNKENNKNIDLFIENLAKGTPGLSGADLANIINESAILSAKNNKKNFDICYLEEAKDRIIIGQKKILYYYG